MTTANKPLINRRLWLVSLLIASGFIGNPLVIHFLTGSFPISILAFIGVFILLLAGYLVTKTARWVFVYLVNFVLLSSVFVHLEAFFRYAMPNFIIEDLYVPRGSHFFNKPCLNKILNDKEYSALYRTNGQGYRISRIGHFGRDVSSCDWLFLGDSFTQGAQVEFEELFTSVLFSYFPDKIILNAGMSGFGLPEEYSLLKEIGPALRPDKVFLQISAFNDFMNVKPRSVGLSDYLMHHSDLARFLLFRLKFMAASDLPLARWTEPFYGTEKENRDYNIFYLPTSEAKRQDINMFKYYLRLISEEVEKSGGQLVLVFLPTREQIYYRYFDEVVKAFHIAVSDLDMSKPNTIAKESAKELGILFLDLTEGIGMQPRSVFYDRDEHLTAFGHHAVAQVLAEQLMAGGLERSKARIVSSYAFGDRYPTCTLEGKCIVFQRICEKSVEIMRTDDRFSEIVQVTDNDLDESHPMVSASGNLIAFTEGRGETLKTKVGVMGSDGSSRRLITINEFQYGAIPCLSADGESIAYAEWFYDPSRDTYSSPQIIYQSLSGSSKGTITDGLSENWRPVFSPDSRYVAYISRRTGNYDIYEYDLVTGRERRLTSTPYDEWDPNYSTDGRKVVYAGYKDGNWDLFEMDRDGSNTTQLTFTRGNEWDPAYCGYGGRLLYAGEFGFMGGVFEYLPENEMH